MIVANSIPTALAPTITMGSAPRPAPMLLATRSLVSVNRQAGDCTWPRASSDDNVFAVKAVLRAELPPGRAPSRLHRL
jgi:hypothetical protein